MPDFGETIDNVEILRTGQHTASSGKRVEIRPRAIRVAQDSPGLLFVMLRRNRLGESPSMSLQV